MYLQGVSKVLAKTIQFFGERYTPLTLHVQNIPEMDITDKPCLISFD